MDPPTRRKSSRVWLTLQLALEDIEHAHGGPLPQGVATKIREWMGRMVDAGRDIEREETVRQQQRAERVEELHRREKERRQTLQQRLAEQRDPRRE